MIKVWCEWDIGLDDRIFSSVDRAKQAVIDSGYFMEVLREAEAKDLDELISFGLLSFIDVEVD